MANTYIAIATVTSTGTSGTIDFTNIPQTYTDLILLVSGRTTWTTDNNDQIRIYLNGNTSNYAHKLLLGTGSVTDGDGSTSAPGVNGQTETGAMTGNTFSNDCIYISNYTSSSNYKIVSHEHLTENNATLNYSTLGATVWSNSSAVTSISISTFRGYNWAQYSTATLYGIKNS